MSDQHKFSDKDPKIVWQKWIDPFGEDSNESKWMDYDKEPDDDIDHEISELKKYIEQQNNNKPIKVIASPLGIIPYNEHTASSKIFNFWVGHTNFSITPDIVKILELADGVETLDVFTRYRFRIAIGKCFLDSDVMQNISYLIKNHHETR